MVLTAPLCSNKFVRSFPFSGYVDPSWEVLISCHYLLILTGCPFSSSFGTSYLASPHNLLQITARNWRTFLSTTRGAPQLSRCPSPAAWGTAGLGSHHGASQRGVRGLQLKPTVKSRGGIKHPREGKWEPTDQHQRNLQEKGQNFHFCACAWVMNFILFFSQTLIFPWHEALVAFRWKFRKRYTYQMLLSKSGSGSYPRERVLALKYLFCLV